MLPQFIQTKDVARILKISHRTLENWRTVGKGPPFVQLGRVVRYEYQPLVDWIAAQGSGGLTQLH